MAHTPSFQVCVSRVPDLDSRIETGWVSTRYGVKQPAPVLSFRQRSARTLAFCSLVAPVGALEGVRLHVQSEPGEAQLRCTVEGRIAGLPVVDELLVALGAAPAAVAEAGLRFRGRHLALRRSHTGQIVYLCAHGVEQLNCDGGPTELHEKEDVEWWQ